MKKPISILFAGDFCPQGRIEDFVIRQDFDAIFNDMAEEFRRADLSIVDLECPLLEGGHPIQKTGPNLKADPRGIEALRRLGVSVVAMANNHIMDYGAEGLQRTLEVCAGAGINTVGVGTDLCAARNPFTARINERTISVLNITENEWSNASKIRPGANPLDLIRNYNDIHEARKESDIVVVVFHGGNEFYELPSPRIKETFRFFVDAGASAVISHHTHIISGYEVYKGAPIFYSLGNFCFDWPGKRKSFWNEGFAVRLVFDDNDVSFEMIPFTQNDDLPGVFKLSPEKAQSFREKILALNAVIADDAALLFRFEQFCQERKDIYDLYLEPYRNPWLQSLRKRKWIPSFLSAQKRRLILNLARCEAHRDVMIRSLEE